MRMVIPVLVSLLAVSCDHGRRSPAASLQPFVAALARAEAVLAKLDLELRESYSLSASAVEAIPCIQARLEDQSQDAHQLVDAIRRSPAVRDFDGELWLHIEWPLEEFKDVDVGPLVVHRRYDAKTGAELDP